MAHTKSSPLAMEHLQAFQPRSQTKTLPASSSSLASSSWEVLVKWLPLGDEDSSWWWKCTGRQLAALLIEAEYEVSQQYQALLFHYQTVVPWLGKRPMSIQPMWNSFMTDDFSPIEYSWKWGQGSKRPDVRYGIEALGMLAGSALDPLNQLPTGALLHQLGQKMPDEVDFTWFRHFQEALFGGIQTAAQQQQQKRSSLFLAFELVDNRVGVKAYFIPVEVAGGPSAAEQIKAAIRAAPGVDQTRMHEAVGVMEAYLKEASSLQTFMLGIDCVAAGKSRLKVYVRSPCISFAFVRNVMTLGGRRDEVGDSAAQFHQLWRLTLGLDDQFPANRDLSTSPYHQKDTGTTGTCFYFDVGPQSAMPDVKAYIPVRHYARSDRQVALGLAQFLSLHRRADYMPQYIRAMESLSPYPGALDAATGVQTYISCAYKPNGELCMTSYLSPQIYHPFKWPCAS